MPANPLAWPGRSGPAIDYISAPPSSEFCARKIRNLLVLGSTGSIGKNVLDVVARSAGRLKIAGLAAGRNAQLLAEQANLFQPPYLAVQDKAAAEEVARRLARGYRPEIFTGAAGYAAIVEQAGGDCVASSQAGQAGLAGTLAAALAGKVVALANKESLVLAGGLVRQICASGNCSILPVDSEHYALFQCVSGRGQTVKKLILTASGGPFRGWSAEELRKVEVADALKHPNWSMGRKITIDSATMMNKGLELIEAVHLFGIAPERLDVLIQPQSIVHSLAEFEDNSILAQLAVPDMRLPISACLNWPESAPYGVGVLDLAKLGCLTFEKVDEQVFQCLRLAREALLFKPGPEWRSLGLNPACIVLSCANEKLVELFLAGKCRFCQIPEALEKAMQEQLFNAFPEIPDVSEAGLRQKAEVALGLIGRMNEEISAHLDEMFASG